MAREFLWLKITANVPKPVAGVVIPRTSEATPYTHAGTTASFVMPIRRAMDEQYIRRIQIKVALQSSSLGPLFSDDPSQF
jgi:hypothetical protein